ncbi:FAD-dependent monooxygenase [Tenacibaculum aiptasiae]|uniref:FAD-dependent monooxygenase n=1 Tax=Tenacibaculum aiptasiae TaxID=426481 RepID=UPI00232F4ADB|nr:FAD-dependent monooxygenase [Tenacibaculum aiptasiae]
MNNISIIGGGIAGLVTALSFEKLNIPYKLYERAETLKAIGAGIWLSPNALQVFEWLDPNLLEEIQKNGNSFTRILVADHKLNPISDSDQTFVKNRFGYTTMAIHRGKLQKILYSYLNTNNIVLGKSFKKYFLNNDSSYKVEFTDGTTIKTSAIVGADGIHSKVRKQLFPKSKIRYSGQTCWRGVSNYELPPKLASIGFTLWGQKLQFGVSKIEDGKTYWFAVKLSLPNQKDNKETLKKNLTKLFSEYHTIANDLIKNTPINNIIRGNLSDLELLDKWSENNISLIGDAAHSMTPDLGQGGAQAIEDAYYLSNLIKKSKNNTSAFDKFYAYRKNKVIKLVKNSRITSKIAITNKPLEILRNFILRMTPTKLLQKQMIELYQIDKVIAK